MRLWETDEIAGELYLVPPARFVAAREELVRQARQAGHRQLAHELHGLRRPTLSAWLVNLLTRHEPEPMRQLFALGRELRHAQQRLDIAQLRSLSAQGQQLIADLLDRARAHAAEAGVRPTEAVLSEVRATLQFGLVDPAAAATVRSGHLVGPRSHAGFGPMPQVDRAGAPPAPSVPDPGNRDRQGQRVLWPVADELARRREQAPAPTAEHADGHDARPATACALPDEQQTQPEPAAEPRRQRAEAEESLRRAEADLAAATSAHWQREHDLADAEAAVETVRDRLESLDRQRMQIRHEKAIAEQHLAQARSAQRAALRKVADARQALEAVEKRLRTTGQQPAAPSDNN